MKSWLIRQLASALQPPQLHRRLLIRPRSDYVEGISPETVQTSLGRDIGHLNLTGARVNAKALQRYGLELLDSVLSVEAPCFLGQAAPHGLYMYVILYVCFLTIACAWQAIYLEYI